MKNILRIVLVAAALAGLGASAFAADQKIAVFNLRKAFDRYYKTIQSTAAIDQDRADVRKELDQMVANANKHKDEWRQLIDKANDQAISPEEREKAKKAAEAKYADLEYDKQSITEYDQRSAARLHEKERQRIDDIVKVIQGVVAAHAKTAGYSMVLDVSGDSVNPVPTPVVLYANGQDDLTDAVIKDLNAAAPPDLLTTNTPALAASTNSSNAVPSAKTNAPSLTTPANLLDPAPLVK